MTDFTGLDVDFDSAALRRGAAGRGRTSSVGTEVVRELGERDIASLAVRRPAPESKLARVKDIHHMLARLIADGKRDVEVSALTGYSPEYIRVLKGDPAFKELMGFYRRNTEAAYADMHERLKALGLSATAELIERLATNPDSLSDDTLVTLVKTSADRTGHGPAAKNLNVNLNVGMADRLEKARSRAQRAQDYAASAAKPQASRGTNPALGGPKDPANRGTDQSGEVIDLEPLSLPAPGRGNPEGGAR